MINAKTRQMISRPIALSYFMILVTFTSFVFHVPYVSAEVPIDSKPFVRAIQVGPDSLDPAKAVASETGRILTNIFEGLLGADPEGKLEARLATRWDVSADALTYTFWLRENVTFHDGSPFSSTDVKYTLERLRNPETAFNGIANFAAVTDIDIVDPHTIQIHLSEPYAPFLAFLASPGVSIVPNGADLSLHDHPVGTGPYQFTEWVHEHRVSLKRFSNYWDPDATLLDHVVFRILPDAAVRLSALLSGDVDVTEIDAAQAKRISLHPQTKVVSGSLNMVQLLAFNQDRMPWNNPKLRQAVAHAIDREWLIDAIIWGYATPLYSALTDVNGYYEHRANPFPYDLERARQLLLEAGFEDGLTTTITVPSNYSFHVDTAQALREQLRAINIELNIELIDWAGWLDTVWAGRNYNSTIIGFTGKLDPHHELQRYSGDYARNFINFRNDPYDAVIHEAIRTSDEAARKKLYAEAQRILAEETAAIFIMAPEITFGVRQDIEGWRVYPHYIDDLRYVYRSKQK